MAIIGFLAIAALGLFLIVMGVMVFAAAAHGFGGGSDALLGIVPLCLGAACLYWAYIEAPFTIAMRSAP